MLPRRSRSSSLRRQHGRQRKRFADDPAESRIEAALAQQPATGFKSEIDFSLYLSAVRDIYGLNFKDFVSLDAGGTLTMTALTNGQFQAGDLFSSDPGLHANNSVALDDDKNLFAAENVVPLIKSAKQNDEVKKTLDAASAKLTTDDLISMNPEAADSTNLSDIAKKWLAGAGIGKS
jgi:glycine betaine/choline ABC-type transport system substrate-binding protein